MHIAVVPGQVSDVRLLPLYHSEGREWGSLEMDREEGWREERGEIENVDGCMEDCGREL